ncbi:hypothetical protein HKD37_06G016665 [Glycine soja]
MACLPNYTPPNVAYIPNEDVNNSTPILIKIQQPQSDHAHVSRPMEETHGMPHHNLVDFEPCLGYTTEGQAVGDLVFASERINVGPERGKFDHPIRTTEKTGANEEGEKEEETHVVTAIPIRPSFPPTQQCHYSANNKPPPYPPPSYPQRPSLNQPQSLSIALPMMKTTFSTNQKNTNKKEFCSKKPVGFIPNPVVIC